jgi:hypothetical protein
LADLIDLQAQLVEDERVAESKLQRRDGEIGHAIVAGSRNRRELLARWIRAVHARQGKSPGKAIERAYRHASALLSVVMFAVGVMAAVGIFHFTGDHPINVLIVLGVFVFLQLFMLGISLLALVVAVVSPGFFEGLPLVLALQRLASGLWQRAAKEVADDATRVAINRLLARRTLYRRVERHVLFRHLQLAAVWFNLGAITVLLVDVTITDLAFGWSTTLQVGAERFFHVSQRLAAPWAGWLEEAVPSLELVRATQYFRLEGAYVGASGDARVGDPAFSGQWWPFLAACLCVYGLLPRVVLAAWSTLMVRWGLRTVPVDTPDIERLVARLTAPAIRRVHGDDPGNVTPLGVGHRPVATTLSSEVRGEGFGVVWRDAEIPETGVREFLRDRYQLGLQGSLGAAGGHDFSSDERFIARLIRGDMSLLLIVAEPWTVPDAALKRFLASVRAHEPERPIVVALTEGGTEEDAAIWAGYLAELQDPYLYFEREVRVSGKAAS